MDAAFGFLPFGARLDCSLLLGREAVRGTDVGTVTTLALMAEMEKTRQAYQGTEAP